MNEENEEIVKEETGLHERPEGCNCVRRHELCLNRKNAGCSIVGKPDQREEEEKEESSDEGFFDGFTDFFKGLDLTPWN